MARKVTPEINWQPRRPRALVVPTRGAHVQLHLPLVMSDVLAGEESRVELTAPEPGELPNPFNPAALPWQPRSDGGDT